MRKTYNGVKLLRSWYGRDRRKRLCLPGACDAEAHHQSPDAARSDDVVIHGYGSRSGASGHEVRRAAWTQFVVVIEPGARSVQTYKNVKRLAEDLGVSTGTRRRKQGP